MINEDHFDSDTTTVYLLKAEPLHDIIDFLSLNGHDLLDTITAGCTTLGSNNAYMPGPLVVCLTPDHAMMLKKDGYTKEMIQEHIHQYVYHQNAMVNGRGLKPVRPKGVGEPSPAACHPLPQRRRSRHHRRPRRSLRCYPALGAAQRGLRRGAHSARWHHCQEP